MTLLTRDYRPGDEQHILKLFEKSFSKQLDIRFWRWRYLENPYGKGIIRIMFEEEEAIGHYAVIPMLLKHESHQLKAALSMTTMTHPDHARKGIFTTLAKEVYSICVKSGISVVYGFPNQNSYHGFTKILGWTGSSELYYFEITEPHYPDTISRNASRLERVYCFYDEMDALWNANKDRYATIVSRNSSYLNWRYFEKPSANYLAYTVRDKSGSLQGYVIINEYSGSNGRVGQIVDYFAIDDDSMDDIIKKAIGHFAENGINKVITWAGLNAKNEYILEGLGFSKRLWVGFDKNRTPTYFGVKLLENSSVELRSVEKLENWYLTMGDSDVF